jgi:hypothetical protein
MSAREKQRVVTSFKKDSIIRKYKDEWKEKALVDVPHIARSKKFMGQGQGLQSG